MVRLRVGISDSIKSGSGVPQKRTGQNLTVQDLVQERGSKTSSHLKKSHSLEFTNFPKNIEIRYHNQLIASD